MIPTIWRIKTCPCCRSRIYHRPVPLFVLKDTLSLLAPNERVDVESDPSDPWEGIFPASIDLADFEDQVSEMDDDEFDDDSFSRSDDQSVIVITDSTDDDSDEESDGMSSDGVFFDLELPPYVPARHRTPTPEAYPGVSVDKLRLIQRGATYPMILRYNMRYEPNDGIVAWTDEGVEVYLGWNILLLDDDAPDGRRFMEWLGRNIHEDPERWAHGVYDGHPVFRRLVYGRRRAECLIPDAEHETGSEDENSD